VTLGVRQDQIFVDPGHDLQDNEYHSSRSAVRLGEITSIGYPLLVSASKPFVSEALGQPREDSLAGVIATMVVCILLGARLIRVHDVAPAIAAVRTTEAILGWRQPLAPRHNLV
jgi:dihydropteroate synthase